MTGILDNGGWWSSCCETSYIGSAGLMHTSLGIEAGLHLWYLNRCLVSPREARGGGRGTLVLKKVQENLLKAEIFDALVVTPGGYDNNYAEQNRFYIKNGFEILSQQEDGQACLVWYRPKS